MNHQPPIQGQTTLEATLVDALEVAKDWLKGCRTKHRLARAALPTNYGRESVVKKARAAEKEARHRVSKLETALADERKRLWTERNP